MRAQRLLRPALVYLAAVLLPDLTTLVPVEAQVSEPAPASQTPESAGASMERVIGVVTATNPAAKQLTVKTDAGGVVAVVLQDKTLYLRVPPGESDLKKAVTITPADIGVGDRVYARGRLTEDRKSIPAVVVIVMTKADLTKKRERELADWQKRAVAGTISALNAETQEIKLSVRSREGVTNLVVESSRNAVFRRYAPDSVQFAQAKSSSFAELKVGDALRILGEKNTDGTRIKPEEIVSGSFRNIAGIIDAIDAAGGEIRITDLQAKKPLTVRFTSDTVLRRMPPTKAATPASRPPEGGKTVAASGVGAGSGGRAAEGASQGKPPADGGRGGAPAAGGAGAGSAVGGAGPGGGALTNLDRMPVLSPVDLKRGEAVLVLCTVGVDPSHVTAIVLVAGVEALLGPAPEGQAQLGAVWNFFDVSLP